MSVAQFLKCSIANKCNFYLCSTSPAGQMAPIWFLPNWSKPEICISAFCNFTAFAALALAGLFSRRWEYSKSLRSSDFSVVCGGKLALFTKNQPTLLKRKQGFSINSIVFIDWTELEE